MDGTDALWGANVKSINLKSRNGIVSEMLRRNQAGFLKFEFFAFEANQEQELMHRPAYLEILCRTYSLTDNLFIKSIALALETRLSNSEWVSFKFMLL